LIIGLGYWQIQNSWLRIAKISLVAVYLAFLIFYQEMFYFHFAKKNSFFWSYGEASFFNHIKRETRIKNIWLSAQSEKLQQYGRLVKYPNYSFQPLKSDQKGKQLENICRDPTNICVFKPDEIKEWHIISKKDTIIYYDIDAIAYVIVKY
jgi:hypothetical protein